MKLLKKSLALLLAAIMVMAMGITAFADESNGYTITVSNETNGYTYVAYQVFKASVDAEGKLGNVVWGSAVDGNAILEKLKADTAFNTTTGEGEAAVTTNDFASCTTADDVAKVLTNWKDDSAKLVAFADLIGKNLKTDATSYPLTYNETGKNYTTAKVPGGYYLVANTATNDKTESGSTATLSRYILKVAADVIVTPKAEKTPEVDKNIVNTNDANKPLDADQDGKGKTNTAAIGDEIKFEITGTVPDTTGYEYYYYIINDTLSEGLTLVDDYVKNDAEKAGGFTVKVGETTLTRDADYYVYKDGQSFKVAFENIKGYAKGAAITITYSAAVNSDAAIGTTPNTNKVTITYSNDPNTSGRGDKDDEPGTPDPTETHPTGTTTEKTTKTYVTELELSKVDGSNNNAALAGAEFTLIGDNLNQVKIETGTAYVKDTDGTYWKLKDGTYTTDDPAAEGMDQSKYESTTTKYTTKTVVTKVTESNPAQSKVTAYVDSNGKLTFIGLNAGTYTLKETHTPAGYNTAADIEFEIEAKVEGETFSWNVKNTGNAQVTQKTDTDQKGTGIFAVTVQNMKGNTLPSTGGIGTTIFYVAGTILVLGAAVVLITKKRMNRA